MAIILASSPRCYTLSNAFSKSKEISAVRSLRLKMIRNNIYIRTGIILRVRHFGYGFSVVYYKRLFIAYT